MRSIRIVTDSTCDLPPDLAERWQIQVVPCYVNFGTHSMLDGVNLSREEFYRRIQSDPVHPSTAAPPPGLFSSAYQRALENASGIISLHPPDQISALRQSAANGWSLLGSDIPYRALDAGQVSMGLGWIAIQAARAAAAGADMNALEALVADLRGRVHVFAALSTIEYLRRSGRVGWAQGAIGRLLRVRPMLHLFQGQILSIGFVRTEHHASERMVAELAKLGALEALAILHTNSPGLANTFRGQINPLGPPEPILYVNATPILGSHVGPGALGFAAVKRSP